MERNDKLLDTFQKKSVKRIFVICWRNMNSKEEKNRFKCEPQLTDVVSNRARDGGHGLDDIMKRE